MPSPTADAGAGAAGLAHPPPPEALEATFQEVLRRKPAEHEFHHAVREVLESLGEPERRIAFRVPWVDDRGAEAARAAPTSTPGGAPTPR